MATMIQGREFEPQIERIDVGSVKVAENGAEVEKPIVVTLINGEIQSAESGYKALNEQLEWVRVGNTPRSEYYANDVGKPYTYGVGAGRRTYEPQPWTHSLRFLQQQAEFWTRAAGQPCRLEVVFLNKYHDGKDQLGWHSDDSPEMDPSRPIVIISFGAEREIWFRLKPSDDPLADPPKTHKLSLPNGSICIMPPGMQQTHQHRIPRASAADCGPRISLTFRGWKESS